MFESTVYPGATEEVCVPILESVSGLVCNRDFFVGYSPERINPGDSQHRVTAIRKVTSGSTPETADFVDALYASIITAGTHRASSIRVAEAAKVIENTQRDVNIALVNELALIFNRLGIDTQEVLEAAATKWNFLPFRPGLVGGHCIGVDPYYLTHKAQEIGYYPEVILAGRRINDSMGTYVGGPGFQADAPRRAAGVRFTRAGAGADVQGKLPRCAQHAGYRRRSGNCRAYNVERGCPRSLGRLRPRRNANTAVQLIDRRRRACYDAIVLAVAHRQFRELGAAGIRAFGKPHCVLYDVKHVLPAQRCRWAPVD